jgi:hypothetical protein
MNPNEQARLGGLLWLPNVGPDYAALGGIPAFRAEVPGGHILVYMPGSHWHVAIHSGNEDADYHSVNDMIFYDRDEAMWEALEAWRSATEEA